MDLYVGRLLAGALCSASKLAAYYSIKTRFSASSRPFPLLRASAIESYFSSNNLISAAKSALVI